MAGVHSILTRPHNRATPPPTKWLNPFVAETAHYTTISTLPFVSNRTLEWELGHPYEDYIPQPSL